MFKWKDVGTILFEPVGPMLSFGYSIWSDQLRYDLFYGYTSTCMLLYSQALAKLLKYLAVNNAVDIDKRRIISISNVRRCLMSERFNLLPSAP